MNPDNTATEVTPGAPAGAGSTTADHSPADESAAAAPPGADGGAGLANLAALAARLTAEQKALLLTGADSWRTHGCEAIGLRPMTTSDGPAGVRGVVLDERHPSSSLPCPSALGATWDPGLVRELAAALGTEARGKGVDILLAPTINLMRTPLGGRGFECFSEDPVLTARLGVAFVSGVQSAGVAATVKHFVGNDSETERWTYDARIAADVLRELYLAPFEACVREAGAALVMAAYNKVNGIPMTENGPLLRDVLKDEWGFGGVAVSDWHATRSTAATALAALDLAMPGPDGPWGQQLAAAVADGTIPAGMLEDKVVRLLRLAARFGALGSPAAGPDLTAPAPGPRLVDPLLLRRAAAASMVLLRNADGLLPVDPAAVSSIAVIGPNAVYPAIGGGGSAAVAPVGVSAPASAIAAALAGAAEVTVAEGCRTWVVVPDPALDALRDPVTGERGTRLEFRGPDSSLIAGEHRYSTTATWWDQVPDGIGWGEPGSIVLTTAFRPQASGPHVLGAAGVGRLMLTVDGVVAADAHTSVPDDPVEAMTRPGEIRVTAGLQAGQDALIRLQYWPAAGGEGPLSFRLGIVADADSGQLMEEAVQAAAQAGTAVVVAGSAQAAESEGFDRDSLALPGRQDELIGRIAAVNPRTVVVINAGMPVLMPWADQVAALIYAWLPGQAMGDAIADVLLGRAEPGGRLPVTLPAAEADCPVLHAVPRDGVLCYDEGLLIGYRGYDARQVTPQFPFGHGLGYTTWDYESAGAAVRLAPGADLDLAVTVRNTGPRAGREVIQAYLAGPPGQPGRPPRQLAAFAGVTAQPGEVTRARLRVPARAFARWDEAAGGWTWPPGQYTVEVGRSSRDLRLSLTVLLGPPG